jgi:hypothetical protein
MRPKRTDDRYWTGTRNFNHIQYESDLEDYIIDLENENQQLRKHAVSGRSEQLKAFIEFADFAKQEYGLHIPLNLIKEYIKSL